MNNDVQKILEEIYADAKITPAEYITFRNKISDIAAQIMKETGNQSILDAFCKSVDVSIQLMQETLLKSKRGEYSPKVKEEIHTLLESYIHLLKVNFDAFK